MTDLVVAPCTYKAAKYACENWHYSKSIPAGRLIMYGIWENGNYVGAILFGLGANMNIGKLYNLKQGQICELVRIAMKSHDCFVTQILSISLKKLKTENKEIRLLISYSDLEQNHEGKIYQASNWLYSGLSADNMFIFNSQKVHKRTIASKYGTNKINVLKEYDPQCRYVKSKGKRRYLMPLDKAMRRQIEPMALPYPKSLAEVV